MAPFGPNTPPSHFLPAPSDPNVEVVSVVGLIFSTASAFSGMQYIAPLGALTAPEYLLYVLSEPNEPKSEVVSSLGSILSTAVDLLGQA
jgi:hypothetical protein